MSVPSLLAVLLYFAGGHANAAPQENLNEGVTPVRVQVIETHEDGSALLAMPVVIEGEVSPGKYQVRAARMVNGELQVSEKSFFTDAFALVMAGAGVHTQMGVQLGLTLVTFMPNLFEGEPRTGSGGPWDAPGALGAAVPVIEIGAQYGTEGQGGHLGLGVALGILGRVTLNAEYVHLRAEDKTYLGPSLRLSVAHVLDFMAGGLINAGSGELEFGASIGLSVPFTSFKY